MMDALPCPFCGGSAMAADFSDHEPRWYVGCSECDGEIGGGFNTEAEAIASWNRRVPTAPALEVVENSFDPPLDAGIQHAVEILVEAGIETFESCEGGEGHAYAEPTIRFHGERSAGLRAAAVCLENDLKIRALRRFWKFDDREIVGPYWEIVFS